MLIQIGVLINSHILESIILLRNQPGYNQNIIFSIRHSISRRDRFDYNPTKILSHRVIYESMEFNSHFVLKPAENYKGLSYGSWVATWWNWLFSDQTQLDSVYFLRGNIDKESCMVTNNTHGSTIYVGTAIFFPIICTIRCKLFFPKSCTEMIRRSESEQSQRNPKRLWASVNGNKIRDLRAYYAESPEFILQIPKASPLRGFFDPVPRIGKGEAVAAGYWLLLKSLPVGTYRIKFEGIHKDGFRSGGDYFVKIIPRP